MYLQAVSNDDRKIIRLYSMIHLTSLIISFVYEQDFVDDLHRDSNE